jgi:hypothetical protein
MIVTRGYGSSLLITQGYGTIVFIPVRRTEIIRLRSGLHRTLLLESSL